MNQLNLFYQNESEREAVKAFFVQTLEELAVERVFDKQSVAGIYEARKVVTKVFDKLEEKYGKPVKTQIFNSR